MPIAIPYVQHLEFEYGKTEWVSPNIRRVIANNPSAFTLYGTGTYIVGTGEVAIIDPGPRDPNHIDAIMRATKDETITHVLITHTHNDHSPGWQLLRERCDALSYGYGPHGSGINLEDGVKVEEGGDFEFIPDVEVCHGEIIDGSNWAMECVYTPGHTSNHICYQLSGELALFSGDHVMGWSTSVISPPDGNMADYLRSLELLLGRNDVRYWPTHGPAIEKPVRHVKAFLEHRREREAQIIRAIESGAHQIKDMVELIYTDTDRRLYPAAARSVFAAIQNLVDKDVLQVEGELDAGSHFYLS